LGEFFASFSSSIVIGFSLVLFVCLQYKSALDVCMQRLRFVF
jgi:hypothetical protein